MASYTNDVMASQFDVEIRGSEYELRWGLVAGTYQLYPSRQGLNIASIRENIMISRSIIRNVSLCDQIINKDEPADRHCTIELGRSSSFGAGSIVMYHPDTALLFQWLKSGLFPNGLPSSPTSKQTTGSERVYNDYNTNNDVTYENGYYGSASLPHSPELQQEATKDEIEVEPTKEPWEAYEIEVFNHSDADIHDDGHGPEELNVKKRNENLEKKGLLNRFRMLGRKDSAIEEHFPKVVLLNEELKAKAKKKELTKEVQEGSGLVKMSATGEHNQELKMKSTVEKSSKIKGFLKNLKSKSTEVIEQDEQERKISSPKKLSQSEEENYGKILADKSVKWSSKKADNTEYCSNYVIPLEKKTKERQIVVTDSNAIYSYVEK